MNQKMIEFRRELAKQFIEVLESKPLTWTKDWIETNRNKAYNAKTKKSYRGINSFLLSIVSMKRGYTDPRFATFNQIKSMGLSLENAKGKGIRIEYWMPRHILTKEIITWSAYNQLTLEEKAEYMLLPKYSVVFNAAHIKGLEPLPQKEVNIIDEFQMKEYFEKLIKNMHISVFEKGNDAYYNIIKDHIMIPKKTHFKSQYSFYSTLAHELSHATLHPSRMNRKHDNYSIEELRAEIASCIFCAENGLELDEEHMENHKAYIQDWISNIKEKPTILIESIKDAEKIVNYLEYQAELISKKDYEELDEQVLIIEENNKERPLEIQKNETFEYEKNF